MSTLLQSSLFQVGVSNAVLVTGLAFFVFLIALKVKWPAWTHALWVLVLLPLGMLTRASTIEAGQPPVLESPASAVKPAENPSPFDKCKKALSDPFGDGVFICGGDNGDPFDGERGGTKKSPFKERHTSSATKNSEAPAHIVDSQSSNAERNQAVEDRLRVALRSEVSQSFPDAPLIEAITYLSVQYDVPFIIDRVALESVGLTTDTPINISIENISMHNFLQLMLRDLEMTYFIEGEVIMITTNDVAEMNPTLKTYILPAELAERSDKVLQALTSNVRPDKWKDAGGTSTASLIDNVLIVSTTEAIHGHVEEFLRKVEAALKVHQHKL